MRSVPSGLKYVLNAFKPVLRALQLGSDPSRRMSMPALNSAIFRHCILKVTLCKDLLNSVETQTLQATVYIQSSIYST